MRAADGLIYSPDPRRGVRLRPSPGVPTLAPWSMASLPRPRLPTSPSCGISPQHPGASFQISLLPPRSAGSLGEGPLVCLPLYPQHLDLCFAQNGHSVSICWMDIKVVHLEEQELPLAPPLDPNLVGDDGHHTDITRTSVGHSQRVLQGLSTHCPLIGCPLLGEPRADPTAMWCMAGLESSSVG